MVARFNQPQILSRKVNFSCGVLEFRGLPSLAEAIESEPLLSYLLPAVLAS